jgi:hypothetical protein
MNNNTKPFIIKLEIHSPLNKTTIRNLNSSLISYFSYPDIIKEKSLCNEWIAIKSIKLNKINHSNNLIRSFTGKSNSTSISNINAAQDIFSKEEIRNIKFPSKLNLSNRVKVLEEENIRLRSITDNLLIDKVNLNKQLNESESKKLKFLRKLQYQETYYSIKFTDYKGGRDIINVIEELESNIRDYKLEIKYMEDKISELSSQLFELKNEMLIESEAARQKIQYLEFINKYS